MLSPHALHRDDRAALDLLLEAEGIIDLRKDAITHRPDLSQRISFAQRRLWFLHQLNPASAVYNIVTAIRLHGLLDLGVLKNCFREIVRRHEMLRTTFLDTGEGPEPRLHERLEIPICVLELSNLAASEREAKAHAFTAEQAALPFNLATGPLLRVGVALLSQQEHIIVLVMHHIVADAWSLAVLVNELSELYPVFAAGLPSPLPELSIQYADYSHWQWENRDSYRKQLEYWQKQLHEIPQLNLPTDRLRPVQPSFAGAVQPLLLPGALVRRLKALGEKEHATLFMTLLAAFQILLSRYTGQTDIVVGAPIAGRNRSELEPLIGFFVNSVVLRVSWAAGASFREVLRHVRTVALQAYENQDVPFDEVVRALYPERDVSHNPLFQVMFSVETELGGPLRLTDASIHSEPVDTAIAKVDLTLNLAPATDGLCGGLEYSTDLFEHSTARRMVRHFVQLLESICEQPDAPVDRLALLSHEERHRILSDFNATEETLRAVSLGQRFEEQSLARPNAVAVEFDGREWSYAELNQIATDWAAELFCQGIRLEDRVAICMEPSFEMVVAVLATIKAGGTYVPLLPAYPDPRIGLILRDAKARVLLTQQHLADRLSQFGILPICLDSDQPEARPLQDPVRTGPDYLANIIYTSGSTGEPKGIEVTHRAVLRLVQNTNYIEILPDDHVALASNFAFDAATFELWGALLNGGRVVGVPREVALDPDRFGRLLRDRAITTLFLTTALFNQIARQRSDAFATLRHLLFGGEAVDVDVVRMIRSGKPPARLLHVYGPTECTTFATWYEVRHVGSQDHTVPIGGPLSNTSAYVVDDKMELLPPGIAGELLLGGPGLSRGYVNRPDLTASLFVPDPFSDKPGERLYRTGDLARWRDNGAIEFLGRIDEQVKIRGFRIEPAEIAVTLTRHPSVKEAVVIVREDVRGKKQLVAYAVAAPGERFSPAELRGYLISHLPEYMIPSVVVELQRLPLNANGKVERKALPAPGSDEINVSVDESPSDERERNVAQAWSKVLRRTTVSRRENYFELGGDSITAIQIVGLLKRQGWQIQVRDIFRNPTVESLASRLTRLADIDETRELQSRAPLTPIQRWFFGSHRGALNRFNQCVLLKCREALDPVRLKTALTALYRRHDALRTIFENTETGTEQVLTNAYGERDLEVVDCSENSAIEEYADAVQGGFDLMLGPLFRAVLFRCNDADRLLLVAHHLVVDGVSWRIIIEELGLAYRQLSQRNAVELGPQPLAWQQFAFTLREHASRDSFLSQVPYWRQIIQSTATDRLPRDGNANDNRFGDMQQAAFQLAGDETRRLLEEAGRAFHTEVNDLLLTALAGALWNWRNIRSSILTLEGHGRETAEPTLDLSGTVGWFTSLFPFRLEYVNAGRREQIITVKEALSRVPNGGVGYGILRYLTPRELTASGESDLSYPASLSFNYLGQFDTGSSGEFWELASENMGNPIAPDLPRQHDLDLTAIVLGGRLNVSLAFNPELHHVDSVAQLLERYRRELLAITEYCCERAPEKTAIDFTCKAFSQSAWDYLRQQHGWTATEVEDVSYLSPMQEGLLFHAMYSPQSRAYRLQMAFDVEGDLNLEALARAWRALTTRHSILRTAFIYDGVDRPIQVVLSTRTNPFTEIGTLPGPDQATALKALRAADLAQGLDLARHPLTRLTIVPLKDRRAHLIWSCHHLLVDGWSLGILSREFTELYRSEVTNTAPELSPAPPYSEYLNWVQSLDRTASRDYWANYLQGLDTLTTIPRLFETASSNLTETPELTVEFDPALTAGLRELATREGVTLNHLIQGIWALLLARYNGTSEVIFGTIVSGRPAGLQSAEHAVGLFINAIPVRVAVPPRLSFSELVRSIRDRALQSEPHHFLPLAEIQTLSEFGRDLISHLLIFENYPITVLAAGNSSATAFAMRPTHIHDETHYDFTLVVTPGDQLHLKLTYNDCVYSADQITRIVGHLETVARSVLVTPDRSVSEFEILPATERERVLTEFNRTSTPLDFGKTSSAKIEDITATAPSAAAIRYGNKSVSYHDLSAHSNAIAAALQRNGVKPGDRVGIFLGRSPALIASMLGAWKARAAYVPIDPDYPPDRVQYILHDSRCKVLVTEPPYRDHVVSAPGCHCLDPHWPASEDGPWELLTPIGTDTAYVIYTSGSTGTPKGCEITHRNLYNYLQWVRDHLHSAGSGTYGLFTSVAFDLTVTSLFVPLMQGRTLHVFDQNADLLDILRTAFAGASGIDTLKCTPSHVSLLRQLEIKSSPVSVCILGGEAVHADQVAFLHDLNPDMRVYNEYGPTETTVGCIATLIPPGESRILIGRPITNTQAYVLDRDGHPAPIGVPGEICIGGEGVGRGYLFRPTLTAERFIPDISRSGCCIYRTGDIGRWFSDGTMEYLGRNDDQVKIRGHRVELGEVQQALARLSGVREAVVLADRRGNETEVVAYVVGPPEIQSLYRRCREVLPSYLVPTRIILMDSLPITRNGKLDRTRLPDPVVSEADFQTEITQPRTATERTLIRIWLAVLGQSNIGVRDNFFELGGHSLKAVQVLSRIHQELGRKVTLRDLFRFPTIEALSQLIEKRDSDAWSRIEPAPLQETYELSYAQKRVWLADRMGASHSLNTPEAILYRGPINVDALQSALRALIERHESLRTAFILVNGKPRQKVCPVLELRIRQFDLRGESDPESRAKEMAQHDAVQPFDLTEPTPMRATLLQLSDERGVFLLTMHHIIGDGWSRRVFYEEFAELYRTFARDLSNPLSPLSVQYKDYAAWHNARDFSREETYWMQRLNGVPEGIALPFDFSIRQKRGFLGASQSLRFSPELTNAVRELAQRNGTLTSYVMLTIFKLVLYHMSRQSDLCVGLSCANRGHPETERLIGFFVNILPVRTRVSEQMEFTELLGEVVATTTQALEYQDYPLDLLIQKLNPPRQSNRPPLINVVYGFHDFLDLKLGAAAGPIAATDSGQSLHDFVVESGWTFSHETAKFDLTLLVTDNRTDLELWLEYDSALFRPETAQRCLSTLEKLTRTVTQQLT